MYVTKRDGRKEEFNADRIFKALKMHLLLVIIQF